MITELLGLAALLASLSGDSGGPVFDLSIGKVVGIVNGVGTYSYGEYFGDSRFYLAAYLNSGGTL